MQGSVSFAQLRLYNPVDTFYYFSDFSYHLNIKDKDSTFKFLHLDSRTTDIEKVFPKPYSGPFYYAKFLFDKSLKSVTVKLYDSLFRNIKIINYQLSLNVTETKESYFCSLPPMTKELIWKTIELK